jgi:hypothetical protein
MAAITMVARIAVRSLATRSGSLFAPLRSLSTADQPFLTGMAKNVDRSREEARRRAPDDLPLASASSTSATLGAYESPFQDLFDRMHSNGPTTLGTTEEYLEFEKERAKHQKMLQCGIPESKLRFTTTSFGRTLIAPHVHPNEHRVVLKINTRNLPLEPPEMEILREIVGNRLNDERQELRLTSNQFGSRIENKRHLVSMLDRIVLSCQRLGAELKTDRGVTDAADEKQENL